jgi:hypothetical protein
VAPKGAGSSPVGHPYKVPANARKKRSPGGQTGGFGTSRAAVDQPNASLSAVAATSLISGITWAERQRGTLRCF